MKLVFEIELQDRELLLAAIAEQSGLDEDSEQYRLLKISSDAEVVRAYCLPVLRSNSEYDNAGIVITDASVLAK